MATNYDQMIEQKWKKMERKNVIFFQRNPINILLPIHFLESNPPENPPAPEYGKFEERTKPKFGTN